MFFNRNERKVQTIAGIMILAVWQIDIFRIIRMIPIEWNIVVSIGFTLLAVFNVFKRKRKKLHEYSIFLHEDTRTEILY